MTDSPDARQLTLPCVAAMATPPTYDVVLADPPWRYSHSRSRSRKVENHYDTMSLADVCALPVSRLRAANSVLFLWATGPKLREALSVMDAWGFEYKTQAMWDKGCIGMGYWFRGQHELLLVGTAGEPHCPAQARRVSSVFHYPRTRHSAKPPEVRTTIERMLPDAKRIELFARETASGWDSWGLEAPNAIASWP